MAWINSSGQVVAVRQFGLGGSCAGLRQEWGREGAYYTVKVDGRKIKLTPGDWIHYDEEGRVPIKVVSSALFASEHTMDPTAPEPGRSKSTLPPPTIAVTTEELEMSRTKLIADPPRTPEASGDVFIVDRSRPKRGAGKRKKEAQPLDEV